MLPIRCCRRSFAATDGHTESVSADRLLILLPQDGGSTADTPLAQTADEELLYAYSLRSKYSAGKTPYSYTETDFGICPLRPFQTAFEYRSDEHRIGDLHVGLR
jgi:hypothetical protein